MSAHKGQTSGDNGWDLKVEYKGKPLTIRVAESLTVDQLAELLSEKTHLNKYRIGMKFKDDNNKDVRLQGRVKTLKEYGLVHGSDNVLEVKDLGPQFSYRGVFVVEYLGPIIIVLLYALRPSLIYGSEGVSMTDPSILERLLKFEGYNWVAKTGVIAWMLHFLKREFETFFVHRFSRPTMPLFNLFKNSSYYWGFALAVGYPLCSPSYTAPRNEMLVYAGFGLMAVCEVLNLAVHLQLRYMRPKEGSDERQPPQGGLFNLASAPNYTFEVLGWVGFSIATNIALAYVFTLVGFLQMTQWATQKHARYVKQDHKISRRAAIIPFIY